MSKLYAVPRVAFDISQMLPAVLYDPSDLSTLFQDSAGTIPVTADGDPVGRILNKGSHQVTAANLTQIQSDLLRPTYRTDGTTHWLEITRPQYDGVNNYQSTNLFSNGGSVSDNGSIATVEIFSGQLLEFEHPSSTNLNAERVFQGPDTGSHQGFTGPISNISVYSDYYGALNQVPIGSIPTPAVVRTGRYGNDRIARFRLDNNIPETSLDGTSDLNHNGSMYIGYPFDVNSNQIKIKFHGAAVYHADIPENALTNVITYFGRKQGRAI